MCLYWRFWLHIWATCALSLGVASQMKDTLYPRSAASALVPMEKNQPAWRNKTQGNNNNNKRERKPQMEFDAVSQTAMPSLVLKLKCQ